MLERTMASKIELHAEVDAFYEKAIVNMFTIAEKAVQIEALLLRTHPQGQEEVIFRWELMLEELMSMKYAWYDERKRAKSDPRYRIHIDRVRAQMVGDGNISKILKVDEDAIIKLISKVDSIVLSAQFPVMNAMRDNINERLRLLQIQIRNINIIASLDRQNDSLRAEIMALKREDVDAVLLERLNVLMDAVNETVNEHVVVDESRDPSSVSYSSCAIDESDPLRDESNLGFVECDAVPETVTRDVPTANLDETSHSETRETANDELEVPLPANTFVSVANESIEALSDKNSYHMDSLLVVGGDNWEELSHQNSSENTQDSCGEGSDLILSEDVNVQKQDDNAESNSPSRALSSHHEVSLPADMIEDDTQSRGDHVGNDAILDADLRMEMERLAMQNEDLQMGVEDAALAEEPLPLVVGEQLHVAPELNAMEIRPRDEEAEQNPPNPAPADPAILIDHAQNVNDANNNINVNINVNFNNNANFEISLDYWHLGAFLLYLIAFAICFIILPALIGRLCGIYVFPLDDLAQNLRGSLENVLSQEDSSKTAIFRFLGFDEDIMNYDGETMTEVERQVVSEAFVFKVRTVAEILLCYFCVFNVLTMAGIAYMFHYYADRLRNVSAMGIFQSSRQLLGQATATIAKVTLVVVLYVIFLPTCFATIMFICTKPIFGEYLQVAEDEQRSIPEIILFSFLYFMSFWVMAHIAFVTSELRPLLRDPSISIFQQGLPIDFGGDPMVDQVQRLQQTLLRRNYGDFFKAFALECCVLFPGLLFTVVIPVKLGHLSIGSLLPLRVHLDSIMGKMQLPGDLLLSHVLVPLLINRLQYSASVRKLLRWNLEYGARLTGCEHLLSPVYFPHLEVEVEPPGQLLVTEEVDVTPSGAEMLANGLADNQDSGRHETEETNDDSIIDEVYTLLEQMVESTVARLHNEGIVDQCDELSIRQIAVHFQLEELAGILEVEEEVPVNDIHAAAQLADATEGQQEVLDTPPPQPILPQQLETPTAALATTTPKTKSSLFLFVLLELSLLAIYSSWMLHGPLLLGRTLLSVSSLRIQNDLLSYPAGLILCLAFGHAGKYIVRDLVASPDTWQLLRVGWKWTRLVLQVSLGGFLWLTTLPLLIGYILEVFFVLPFRFDLHTTPVISVVNIWTTGIVLLKIFVK